MATGHRQDGRDGDADRLAHAQQGRRTRRTAGSATPSSSSRPGITIRDRLRVLLPVGSGQLLPASATSSRPTGSAISAGRRSSSPTSTPSSCGRRSRRRSSPRSSPASGPACSPRRPTRWCAASPASSARKRNIVVINDEAHHCYRRRVGGDDSELDSLSGEDKREAAKRDEEARVWLTGPAGGRREDRRARRLRPVGHAVLPPGLGLAGGDAVPVGGVGLLADRRHRGRAREDPAGPGRRQRRRSPTTCRPTAGCGCASATTCRRRAARPTPSTGRSRACPGRSRARCRACTATTRRRSAAGRRPRAASTARRRRCSSSSATTPTSPSWSSTTSPAGRSRCPDGGSVVVPGKLDLFSNADGGRWSARPKTILVDSTQLESGEAMSAEFKAAAAAEIEEFKAELRQRFPGRDVDELTDEDLLREVMNTVGKPGKLGEQRPLRRVGLDAHRGLGRQHRHPRPRRPRLRHPAAVRAGRRPGAAPALLRRRRRRPLRARVRRGLRRPVQLHPGVRVRAGPEARPDPDAGAGDRGPHRVRDHLPAPRRLPVGDPRRAPRGRLHRRVPPRPRLPRRPDPHRRRRRRRRDRGAPPRTLRGDARPAGRVRARQAPPRPLLPRADDDGQPGAERPWLFPRLVEITKRWIAECVDAQGRRLHRPARHGAARR